jgi:hypothetical protein
MRFFEMDKYYLKRSDNECSFDIRLSSMGINDKKRAVRRHQPGKLLIRIRCRPTQAQ